MARSKTAVSAAARTLTRGHKKKARTRQQLLEAALRIYARKGVGELALNELADEAGVSNGTVYNYFRTREDVLQGVGLHLAEVLSRQVTARSEGVSSGAWRLSIGVRVFVRQALQDRDWASAVIRVINYDEGMRSLVAANVRHDLQSGLAQGELRYADEDIAVGMVISVAVGAMAGIVDGYAAAEHDVVIIEMLLMALGVTAAKARRIAALPLPAAAEDAD